MAKLPLLDRCPEKFVKMKLPTLWLYGDKDWMNDEAGLEMTNEINDLSIKENSKNLPVSISYRMLDTIFTLTIHRNLLKLYFNFKV